MPSNVTTIRKDAAIDEIDIREEQQALIEAENACLTMLETFSKANLGFVSFIRKMQYSNCHPKTRLLLDRSEKGMQHVFGLFSTLSDSHKIAEGMATSKSDAKVVMTGGIPKEDKPGRDRDPEELYTMADEGQR